MRNGAVVDYNQRAVKIDEQPANLSRSNRPDISTSVQLATATREMNLSRRIRRTMFREIEIFV